MILNYKFKVINKIILILRVNIWNNIEGKPIPKKQT